MKNVKKKSRSPKIRSDGYAKDIVYSLEIDSIRANSAQPRRDFDIDSIIKLADSIRRYGILQPLSVRRAAESRENEHKKRNIVADVLSASLSSEPSINVSRETLQNGAEFDEYEQLTLDNLPSPYKPEQDPPTSTILPPDTRAYELVAGERRLRAAKMLGMRHVPCIIVDVNDAISAELALVENMLRENLNMFEQAAAFANLAEKYSLTQEEIAAKMSLSQSAVANKIRLLKLSEEERQLITEASLTERHARAFLRIGETAAREACIRQVIDRKLNVNDTDRYITELLSGENVTSSAKKAVLQATPEKLCSNIYKFVNRMQGMSGNYLTVNRKSDDKNVVITLTIRKGS